MKLLRSVYLFCVVALLSFTLASSTTSPLEFNINTLNVTGPWNHYWERCVGSGHAALALRADYQAQMRQTRTDLGFQQVRFHGIFVDDMSVVLPNNTGVQYSFFNVDRIYDFLLSIGMKPYIEISFMPKLLASGNATWSHYTAYITPPTSWDSWADLVTSFTRHLVDRYGLDEVLTWNFEVWNEPNCCPHDFWTGNQTDYFTLFNWTSRAVKAVDPRLKVGGPTTAMSMWIKEFMSFCKENSVPYDFIDTHEYPTDPPGPQSRTFFRDHLQRTRDIVGPDFPIYYTEYDDGYNDDSSYAASFATFTIFSVHNIVDILSWWPFSDIFEEQGLYSDPFNPPCAGLVNIYGIPKPSYRAFQLLHWSGNKLVDVHPNPFTYDTVSAYGVIGNNTSIFVVNWNAMNLPIQTEKIRLVVAGVKSNTVKAVAYRIDTVNGNALPVWEKMGKPFYLNSKQVELLTLASEIHANPISFTIQSSTEIIFDVDLEPYGIINIILS